MNSRLSVEQERELAEQKIERFVRRFDPSYLLLAYHAALPLVLTPELVNYLRVTFLRGDVPFEAEVDLLLSDLCSQAGYELYTMESAVRACLIEEMEQTFGVKRMQEVAYLLLNYIHFLSRTNPYMGTQELQAQQWAAMVYLDDQRDRAVRKICEAFQNCMTSDEVGSSSINRREMARLARITQELAPQLKEYSELLEYAQIVSRLLRNAQLPDVNAKMPIRHSYHVLPSLELRLPDELIPSELSRDLLKVFEFEVVTVNAKGAIVKKQRHLAQSFTENLINDIITLEMVAIPAGHFFMGSSEEEENENERPQHEVVIHPLFISKYQITQSQWQAIANLPKIERDLNPSPSYFKGDNRPVESISWYDAIEFCRRLSQLTGREYRLPSEAEWEYACRAGTTTSFYFGETITGELANYRASETFADEPSGEYRGETTPVGHFPPNAFGLYDLHGNVLEWCADSWHENYEGAPSDGSIWAIEKDDTPRLLRGGSWENLPTYCRSSSRNGYYPEGRNYAIGFRVVLSVPQY